MSVPQTPPTGHEADPNPQKRRTGVRRIWHATRYSIAGLRAGWTESAFRQEVVAAVVLLPAGLWLGQSWVERALLTGSILLVMIVELLNSGIEAAIDRVGLQWHALSKRAKDLGSAAVLLSLVLWFGIWTGAIWQKVWS
ncbi:MAG: diacylglycerol kinase [Burkholderiaceae bacterium]